MALIDIDKIEEIVTTLQKNKRRSILSSLGVLFSISFLIMVMGLGGNIETMISESFGGLKNFIYVGIYNANTSYMGYSKGRAVSISKESAEGLNISTRAVERSSVPDNVGIGLSVKYNNRSYESDIVGISEQHGTDDSKYNLVKGRLLNKLDYTEKRQVILLSEWFYNSLGKPDIVGKHVDLVYEGHSSRFLVVGVISISGNAFNFSPRDLHVPMPTIAKLYKTYDTKGKTSVVHAYIDESEGIEKVSKYVKATMRRKAAMAPTDSSVFAFDMEKELNLTNLFITSIFILIWIVSIGTLLAGVISISNIMLIVLKERTQEIGVRRALGATPRDIITQVMTECFILTFLTGLVALTLGVMMYRGAVMVINNMELGDFGPLDAVIDLKLVAFTFIIVVISSVLAGVIPAIRASKIRPVEAIREE